MSRFDWFLRRHHHSFSINGFHSSCKILFPNNKQPAIMTVMNRFLLLVLLVTPGSDGFTTPLACTSKAKGLLRATISAEGAGFDFSYFNQTDIASSAKKKKAEEKIINASSAASSPRIIGIGGNGGVVYDVNKLKKNLVQQTVRDYKQELWNILGSSDPRGVEEKLAALCQVNPVSTTTDSNLLEGCWSLVMISQQSAQNLLTDTTVASTTTSLISGKTRRIVLEDTSQVPHVEDCQRFWGGLWHSCRRLEITGLTRTTLELDLRKRTYKLFGILPVVKRSYLPFQRMPQVVKILYMDTDLCISTHPSLQEPLFVYTNSPAWVARTQQVKRRVQKLIDQSSKKLKSNGCIAKRSSSKTLHLGQVGYAQAEDDMAWEGQADPFVHLEPEERQRLLKKMHVAEIQALGKKQKELAEKERKILERERRFTKPAE
jgi:hypothetical protein